MCNHAATGMGQRCQRAVQVVCLCRGGEGPEGCWLPAEEQRLARTLVETAGLNYLTEPYIGDVAREIRASR